MRRVFSGVLIGAVAATTAYAQSVISAHSGTLHYIEGRVLVGDKPVQMKPGEFPELKDNAVLKTEEGRAEILLTPGVFLRIGENGAVRMLSNRLSNTRVELLSGEAVLECAELLKDNAVTILDKEASIAIAKAGLYRFDTSPARLRVYEGEAEVTAPSGHLTLKKGRETMLDGALMAVKFDAKVGDELMRWASRRASYVAAANVASAHSMSGSSYYVPSYGMWSWNPWFGMFTFMPGSGILWSPFGYPFWSPYAFASYFPYYGFGYYPYYGGGYYPGNGGKGQVAFSGAPRWSAVSQNSSGGVFTPGRAHGAPGGVVGAIHNGRGGGGDGFGGGGGAFGGGRMGGGYSGGGYSGGYSGGGVSGGGGMAAGGGAAVSGGGGGHAGGGGGGHR